MAKLFIKEFYTDDTRKDLSEIANKFAEDNHCIPIQIQSVTMPKKINDDGFLCENVRVLTVLFESKEENKKDIW